MKHCSLVHSDQTMHIKLWTFRPQQQIHAQQLPSAHSHGPPLPMMPHPGLAGLQPPTAAAAAAALSAGMPPSSSAAAGLLALSAAGSLAGSQSVPTTNSTHHLPGLPSSLAKESTHRENNDTKRVLNGQLNEVNSNYLRNKFFFT